jgi:DNA-binding NarL/FixJ family response regulator
MGTDGVVVSTRPRVVVADDEVLIREGVVSLLERSGLQVVGTAGDGPGLLDTVRENHPDLVVADIRMPPTHRTEGLDVARQIRAEFPQTAVMLLSAHAHVEQAMDLLAEGKSVGYLLKDRVTDADELLRALRRVLDGGSVVDPSLVRELVELQHADDPLAVLSAREREVLALMAEGRSNAAIGRALWVSEGTVEKHVRSIFMKLGLPDSPDDHRRILAVLLYLNSR